MTHKNLGWQRESRGGSYRAGSHRGGSYRGGMVPTSYYRNGVTLNGTSGYVYTADKAALDIIGDIEVVSRMTANDWTPTAGSVIAQKVSFAAGFSWLFTITGGGSPGRLQFNWSPTGAGASRVSASSTANAFTDGTPRWIKLTFDVDNGAAGSTAVFSYAADQEPEPSSWTTLSTVVTPGVTSLYSGPANLQLWGGDGSISGPLAGTGRRTIVRSGIGGTVVADFDARRAGPNGYTDAYGNAWVVVP